MRLNSKKDSLIVKPSYKIILLFCAAIACFLTINPAFAQNFSVDFGEGGSVTARVVQMIALLTVLSLAPSLLVMITSFTRIIVVLSLLRTALGTQQAPPTPVLVSLALFLTFFIMQPTLEVAYTEGIAPLIEQEINEEEAFDRVITPFRDFMLIHVRPVDLQLMLDIANIGTVEGDVEETPLRALIPAFMLSELKRAFEIGFLLFVPFLIIDMVIASLLMAMGMMMLPPVIISLPFKLVFFVLVDGWALVAGSLVRSFG